MRLFSLSLSRGRVIVSIVDGGGLGEGAGGPGDSYGYVHVI